MHDKSLINRYIKQTQLLAAGLKHATEKNDVAQIVKYESLVEALLLGLAGKTLTPRLRLELSKLKVQHQQTSKIISQQLNQVKKELSNLNGSKKRMRAYHPSSKTNIIVKA